MEKNAWEQAKNLPGNFSMMPWESVLSPLLLMTMAGAIFIATETAYPSGSGPKPLNIWP